MGSNYNPRRKRNLYISGSNSPFKLSRSKIEMFQNCRRCFYLDRVKGTAPPPGYPFNLNSAVDALLKCEFDHFRSIQKPHPLMESANILATPFLHPQIDDWRDSLHKGITFHHEKTNLIISGGIDDLWINDKKELIIVDYKATSKADAVTIDAPWQQGYRRQMDIYSWLFKMNGFAVHDKGYFVYCNGKRDVGHFNSRLEFSISILPYKIEDNWVDDILVEIKKTLDLSNPPASSDTCDICKYFDARKEIELPSSNMSN